ncbi:hypothetical protein HRG_007638 [Hirsutella rhossiliensis]|uniref:Uncharacterized protein n=1 Tax=Hirsutella rhossiliensis TaxID=111463 RepID=A0A9P8MUQ0_9HYPO|nr:uncharacterized protein HRG_07638 [Hirsutella rhossiliensis]KAH0961560.1 hypothetical protein HRG_07638 [Hirsutella rhossiliensis]
MDPPMGLPSLGPKSPGQGVESPGKQHQPKSLTPRRVAKVKETPGLVALLSPGGGGSSNDVNAKATLTVTNKDGEKMKNGEGTAKADEMGTKPGQAHGPGHSAAIEAEKISTPVRLPPRRRGGKSGKRSKKTRAKNRKKRAWNRSVHSLPQSPAVKAKRDSAPATLPPGGKDGGGSSSKAKKTPTKSKIDEAKKKNEDRDKGKTGISSEQIRGLKPSLATKADRDSAPAGLTPQYRDGDKANATTATKKNAETVKAAESLSEQVRNLEEQEARQRKGKKVLAAENRRLGREISDLKLDYASVLSTVNRLEAMNHSLHSIRDQTADKLDAANEALQVERARADGLAVDVKREREAYALLVEREKRGTFELRKFRTALAAAFKLLPSLEDQVSFRGLVERTERHLREKMAGEGAGKGTSLVPGDKSARALKSKLAALDGKGDEVNDDVKPNVKTQTAAGPVGAAKPEIIEAKVVTAKPAQASAPETTPAGQQQSLKRERQESPLVVWSDDEFDVPLAKRRRSVK